MTAQTTTPPRGKALMAAILKLMQRAGRRGVSIHEIRSKLRLEKQQHLDRRVRELDGSHKIERRVNGGQTFYVYRGPAQRKLDASPISKKLRAEVLNAHGRRCQMCGRTPSEDQVRLHVDHRVPRQWGGKTVFENLEPLCSECNEGKKNLFRSLPPRRMRLILATESVHERLALALHAKQRKPVAARLLMLIANAREVQDDWQKRLRELRYVGLKIDVRRHTTPEGYVATDYVLTNWVRLPADLTRWVRYYERQRAKRNKAT